MEPGWKSPSSEICWNRVDLTSTKAGNGSGIEPPCLTVVYTLRIRPQKKKSEIHHFQVAHSPSTTELTRSTVCILRALLRCRRAAAFLPAHSVRCARPTDRKRIH